MFLHRTERSACSGLFQEGWMMSVGFEPQFHKRVARHKGVHAWMPLPQPRTLMPVKSVFYRQWQIEERLKLQAAGETVLPDNDRRSNIASAIGAQDSRECG